MQKLLTTLLLCLFLTQSFAQKTRKISTYLLAQFNKTLNDYTFSNNPTGAGLGIQSFYNNKTRLKPTVELTGAFYVGGKKVLLLYPDGSPSIAIEGMVNLLAGSAFNFTENFQVAFLAGPAFINHETLLTIKPSLGFFFTKNKRLNAKISYINIFNRTKIVDQDFGSLSFAFGVKLF